MGTNLITSKAVSSAVSPISIVEFARSIIDILPLAQRERQSNHGTSQCQIGLAISGGVDSMALALLCSELKSLSPSKLPNEDWRTFRHLQACKFRAFVVDHGVRKGSHEEAQAVVEVLKGRDISAEVLNFQWTSQDGGNPAFAPNFESLARKHRFQTLGLACHRYNIRSLLLAHHEDDQAETLLMRLINGHKMLGLTGMKAVAEIPECHGIYGAHQSVEIRNFGAEQFQQPQMTSGGVKVYRPLLNFNKARLRATCEDANMEWFEDHTNQDPALTMRNSVRKLYRSHKLPPALSKSSLLALSQRARQRHSSQLDIVNRFLTACQMSKFETKSGILQIQFPDIRTFKVDTAIYSAEQLRMPAAMLLRRVIKIITPNEHVELAALTSMLPHVFPETFAADVTSSLPPNKRTIAGVQFDPISSSSTQKPEWLISRQNAPRPKHKTVLSVLDSKSCSWTPWAMIDGRYWLRVKDDMERSLTVELLGPQQLGAFLSGLDEKTRKSLKRDLKEFAPGNIRWTLLALIHEERVVALPTLCYKALGQEGLQWEVLYKKVDLEGLVKKE